MRDFRDAKAMAQTVRAALAAKGLKITISESLELIAKAFGAPDWNTLSAAIKAAEAEPKQSQAAAIGAACRCPPSARALRSRERAGGLSFNARLEATLHRAVGLAAARKHGSTTLEHLLLALIEDADAADVMRACKVDLGALAKTLTAFVDNELKSLVVSDGEDPRADRRLPAGCPAGGDSRPDLGPRRGDRRQCAGCDLLRARKRRRRLPAAAGDEPVRRGELHRPWQSQRWRQSGLGAFKPSLTNQAALQGPRRARCLRNT